MALPTATSIPTLTGPATTIMPGTPTSTAPTYLKDVVSPLNYATAPNLGVTPGSASEGTFTQGAALPNITTSQTQATSAPEFYTDYLNQLAKQGASAVGSAGYVGPTDLQKAAFNQVGSNVGNYMPALNAATGLAQTAGGDISGSIDSFYNKYNTDVINSMGSLGQANIAQNLAPQANAGVVGSGGFGSQRGIQALGEVFANAGLGLTAQQYAAKQAGYTQAQQAAQQQAAQQLGASQQLGSLATSTQGLGMGDVNALATIGGQQQTIAQNQQNFPMQQLTNASQLLRGYTMPTSTSASYTGPIPGSYAASPLQQIAGLGALAAGVSKTPLGDAIGTATSKFFNNLGALPVSSATNNGTSIPSFTKDIYGNQIVTVDGVSYNEKGESLGV